MYLSISSLMTGQENNVLRRQSIAFVWLVTTEARYMKKQYTNFDVTLRSYQFERDMRNYRLPCETRLSSNKFIAVFNGLCMAPYLVCSDPVCVGKEASSLWFDGLP